MSRMKPNALTELIESADTGGYTLPGEVIEAHRTARQVRQIPLPATSPQHADVLAARTVGAVAAGESVDLLACGRLLVESEAERVAFEGGRRVLEIAVEQADSLAVTTAAERAEQILVEHLRPAYLAILEQTRQVAAALDGFGLDAHQIVTAPAKVRTAYRQLPELVDRRRVVQRARTLVNLLADQTPQHDVEGLFADFRKPLTFFPTWQPPARVPALPYPEDPRERLLWLASPAAAIAEPWLPTIAERDAAWWDQFGEGQQMRAHAALSARAHAGQRV